MSKFFRLLFLVLLFFLLPTGGAQAGEPQIVGEAAVLMDLDTGRFLYEKNADRAMSPASTAKILTALVAVQNGRDRLDERVVMSEAAIHVGGSAIWPTPDEEFSLRELLWSVILVSANDAATAVAEHVHGSVEEFVAAMNAQAWRLGAHNSHFVNPHGLHDERQYTTARDLALIARAALAQPLIREMTATKTYRLTRADPDALSLLVNHNKLLWRYEGAIGLKTGYTVPAGQCLVSAAERNGRTVLAVVLKSEGTNIWTDSAALLDYGHNRFRSLVPVREGDEIGSVPVVFGNGKAVLRAGSGVTHVVPVDDPAPVRWQLRLERELIAPLGAGEQVGTLIVHCGDEEIGQAPVLVAAAVPRLPSTTWWYRAGLVLGGLFLLILGLRFSIRRSRARYYRRRRRR
ncbi:MAG: D-alanyl-D-alanine carboxypeptidase family protein [Bacillota bacterium]